MRRATMHDVAARAGVSLKTVSRVVNVERGVSAELIDKVQLAARELDYRHNLAARSLRVNDQRSASFAVLVQDLSNGYSAALLRAVDDVSRDHDAVFISASLDEEEEREHDLVSNLINRRVDGLILMPTSRDQSYLQRQLEAGFAVVCIDRPPNNLVTDSVVVDNVDGARRAVAHLAAHGHRRIAVITDDLRIRTAGERLEGYRRAIAEAGLSACASYERSARTATDAAITVRDLMSSAEPPTAVFSARNAVTEGVVLALQQLGLSHRVAVVGFDDLALAELLSPGLTVVAQQAAEVGRHAAELLLSRVAGDPAPTQSVVLPTRLVVRGSGEIPPFEEDVGGSRLSRPPPPG